jgi:hypothetical protein
MQEDNWSKRLADSLRKQQEDSPLPYEPGAWEAFEKRRKTGIISPIYYWLSGVAASIALVFMIGYGLLSPEEKADQVASAIEFQEQAPFENPSKASEIEVQPENVEEKSNVLLADAPKSSSSFKENAGRVSAAKVTSKENLQIANSKSSISAISTEQIESKASESHNPPLIALEEKVVLEQQPTKQPETKSALVPMTEEEAKAKLMAQIGEELKEEAEKEKRVSSVVLGFGPGFGSSTQNNVATSGSNLGLGVAYDMNLGKKLALGSGLGLNYLNQSSQSQDYAQVAGFASAVQETQQVQQVQVDIPLYVRYPVTRDNSISLQAGFSNLITFNQLAEQVQSFTRQVYVADAMNVSANASTLRTEQVSLASDLIVPSQRFFPLATANLGVNIRVYESPKTSYLVMPFYNYPIQDISGTGQNPGVVGAAFKVRFGAIKK